MQTVQTARRRTGLRVPPLACVFKEDAKQRRPSLERSSAPEAASGTEAGGAGSTGRGRKAFHCTHLFKLLDFFNDNVLLLSKTKATDFYRDPQRTWRNAHDIQY